MNFQAETLIVLFFGHWVGDYLFQTSNMAVQKSSSIKWLGLHVLTYTVTLSAFSFVFFPLGVWWKFVLLNGLLHGITDFFTSRIAKQYAGTPRVFYPILGFDQFIHLATLVYTLTGVQ
jgi:Protein of unknown function (DUF3307)